VTKAIAETGDNISLEVINLKPYAPKLRKLAQHILRSDSPLTIAEACLQLGLNKDSIYTMMTTAKNKGNDLSKLINSQMTNMLNENKLRIGKSLVNEAVSGAVQSQKLYYQLTGDLKEEANITVNNLTIGINIVDSKPEDMDRDKGIIDVTPNIPKGKREL